jgi:hypothetical protein
MPNSIYRQLIPETVIPGKRLGRHIHHDARSLSFPAQQAPALRSVRHISSGLPLDQGQVASCTGNALCGALNSRPHWASGQPTLGERDALHVYSTEEVLEGVGPYPPNDQGGSGTEVCKAAKNLGWLSSFETAQGLAAGLRALVLRPVIIGINWYTSFDTPSSSGLISLTADATVRGGHELDVDEIDVEHSLIGGWQSWGSTEWPAGGRFYLSFDDFDTLLAQHGDITVPRTAPNFVANPISS